MPPGLHLLPTYAVLSNLHKNVEPITNARVLIDVSRIVNGSISDFQFGLSNDGGVSYISCGNNERVLFSTSSNDDVLYLKIAGKPGVQLCIEHQISGKSFPLQVFYNEVF